jgi:two-component system sensor histidine kinase PilS (NtrC family)
LYYASKLGTLEVLEKEGIHPPPPSKRGKALRLPTTETRFTSRRADLLRWLYVGRLTLVSGILAGAFLQWFQAGDEQTLVAVVAFLSAFFVTGASFWHSHLPGREPGDNFVYAQVIFDALLVTSIVHITGGGGSPFAPLYILVISSGALLLPLPGGVLVGVLATILFFADTVWSDLETFNGQVFLQLGLFAAVAVITGWLGDRVRRAGLALGRVESELRQLRLDTGDILASIATGVMTIDGEGRLMYLNPAGEAILGIKEEQWLGAKVLDAVEKVGEGLGSLLRRSVEEGTPVVRFKTVAHTGGVETILGGSTTILDREEEDRPSVTAIFQDITDLERVDALNRRTERLEAVAELSASLAHEIKNPLASIRSAVEQISRGKLGGEDRGTLERLVVTESDRLSRLLSDFIEFSALRMGRAERVDLAELARDCLSLVRQSPEVGEGIRFEKVGMDDVVMVPGDLDLLHRIVFNLVLNAAQFCGPEGRVTLEIRSQGKCRTPSGMEIQNPVCICVSDSGPGIPPEDLPKIFDPFFTNRVGGSGLGLSLVHRAVEAHSGTVLVDRGAEGGARFSIYLPGESKGKTEEAS